MNLGPRHRYRITEKMIAAGRRILISFSPDVEDYDDIVAEIFRAMMKAMREGDTE